MCCCVEHNIRSVFLHDPADAVRISHGADQHFQIKAFPIFSQEFLLDLVSIVLIHIEDDQLFRMCCRYLPAQFASDRSSAAGYQQCLPAYGSKYLIHIYFYLGTSEQVCNLDIAKSADIYFSVYKLIDSRNGLKAASGVFADIQDSLSIFRRSCRNRINNAADPVFFHHFRNLISVTDDRDPFQYTPILCRVIINNAHHLCIQFV